MLPRETKFQGSWMLQWECGELSTTLKWIGSSLHKMKMLPGTASFMSFNAFGTIVTVIAKGCLAGLVSALIYKLS